MGSLEGRRCTRWNVISLTVVSESFRHSNIKSFNAFSGSSGMFSSMLIPEKI